MTRKYFGTDGIRGRTNTAKLTPEEAEAAIASESDRLGMPVADPMRGGPAFERLLDACLA